MRINGTTAFSAIKLAEGQKVPTKVQILKTGTFSHPRYGVFEITSQTLSEMKAHFDNKIRGIDMAFDYFHESDKEASAWVKELVLEESGTELWAEVDWTPKAEQKLSERELRYFSPDFAFQWTDPEKSVTFNNVLFGGGLTNRPFLKEMKAIVADETQGEKMTELEKAQKKIKDLEAANVKLSEDKAAADKMLADAAAKHVLTPAAGTPAAAAPGAHAPPPAAKLADPAAGPADEAPEVTALKKQIADLQAQLAKAQGDSEVALAEKNKADAAKCLAEKESAFTLLLTEGKACAAQKAAFLAGNMTEFVKLSQPVNLKGSGHSGQEPVGEDKAAAIIKLAEEKEKANPRLSRGEAISMAMRELKK